MLCATCTLRVIGRVGSARRRVTYNIRSDEHFIISMPKSSKIQERGRLNWPYCVPDCSSVVKHSSLLKVKSMATSMLLFTPQVTEDVEGPTVKKSGSADDSWQTPSMTPSLISRDSADAESVEYVAAGAVMSNHPVSTGLAIPLNTEAGGGAIVKEGQTGSTHIKVTMTTFANYSFAIQVGERETSIIVPSSRIHDGGTAQPELRQCLSSLIAKAPQLDLGRDEKWATLAWKKTTKQIVVNLCMAACEEHRRFQRENPESDDDISLADIEDNNQS